MRLGTAIVFSLLIHGSLLLFDMRAIDFVQQPLQKPVAIAQLRVSLPLAGSVKIRNDQPVAESLPVQKETVQKEFEVSTVEPEIFPGVEPDSYYFLASEIDQRPVPQSIVKLDESSVPPDLSGKVQIQLWVSENGDVERIEVVSSNVPEKYLQIILAGRQAMRFTPGKLAGAPVKSIITYEIEFVGAETVQTASQ